MASGVAAIRGLPLATAFFCVFPYKINGDPEPPLGPAHFTKSAWVFGIIAMVLLLLTSTFLPHNGERKVIIHFAKTIYRKSMLHNIMLL